MQAELAKCPQLHSARLSLKIIIIKWMLLLQLLLMMMIVHANVATATSPMLIIEFVVVHSPTTAESH